jgi:hypothetical protein
MFALSAITRARRPTRRTRPRPEPLVSMTAESAAALPMTTTLTTPPETRPARNAARWPRRPLSAGDSDRPATTSSYAPRRSGGRDGQQGRTAGGPSRARGGCRQATRGRRKGRR